MLIYNVTINISDESHDEWVSWMKESHIPDVMNTGCFTHFYFTRVLTVQPDETGKTYSIQYHCEKNEDYDKYIKEHAESLQKEHLEKFDGEFVAFRTLLEKV